MALAGLRLHALKGDLNGFWVVDVSDNWRIVFCFDGEEPVDVFLVDSYIEDKVMPMKTLANHVQVE